MKKRLATILSIMLLMTSSLVCDAKNADKDLTEAIKLYKEGNYTACYQNLSKSIKKDSSNALAYYYLAMSAAQVGKTNEAINNYSKVIALSNQNSNLRRYAEKGQTCLIDPEKCEVTTMYSSLEEEFILRKNGPKITDEVKSEFERLKIEQLMREMNRSKDIEPRKFKEYKDFSSYNSNTQPSNDEIVAALRTLQNAGFSDILSNNNDLSLITGVQTPQSNIYNLMNNQTLSPQVIQMMLTNNMSAGF